MMALPVSSAPPPRHPSSRPSRRPPFAPPLRSSPGRSQPMTDLRRRLVAEALGTGLLVATVVGSGIMAERLTQDGALALLANTLPTGAILVVLISVLGPLSGAHLNPAVSLVLPLRRALPV